MTQETRHRSDRNVWLWIAVAYVFGIAVRMIWVYWAQQHPEFYYNGELMINTNDGYMWAASAQHYLTGAHASNPRLTGMFDSATVFLTVLLTKYTPLSLETVILYMPAFVSSLIVVPLVLLGRLYGNTLWGFVSALLAVATWSFYNRTMVGYYDTDMFAVVSATFILYFLIASVERYTLKSALYASIMIALYPFLYDQGKAIVIAMGVIYWGYLIFYHRKDSLTYRSVFLVAVALMPIWGMPAILVEALLKVGVLVAAYVWMSKHEGDVSLRTQAAIGIGAAVLAVVMGDAFGIVLQKVFFFLKRDTTEGSLHYLLVNQTVREAGHIPFDIFAKRISGSVIGFVLAMAGYVWLVWKHRAFVLALPLLGIGLFAVAGGLRFTVYAVPIAALSVIFLVDAVGRLLSEKREIGAFGVLAAGALLLVPNIEHIVAYKVPTVLDRRGAEVLASLDKQASSKDYTIAWWDYGYPVWFYSDTNTIIDGGKHQNDNYIVSKIFQSTSPLFAANFARLAVETYVENNYTTITSSLFRHGDSGKYDPDELLAKLNEETFPLPSKTREIYLYAPVRMMFIYPVVTRFGNIDLKTGKPLREVMFTPLRAYKKNGEKIYLEGGIVFDVAKGVLVQGSSEFPLKAFVVTRYRTERDMETAVQPYRSSASSVLLYLESYGLFVLMDAETYRSNYVQMFLLGKYDPRYFEPIVSSPVARVYRIKR